MKLIYRILIQLSAALMLVMTAWGLMFYLAIIDEINDEVDDALENYSENIITRSLAGEPFSSTTDGSNNTYQLKEVTQAYASLHEHIRYSEKMVFIEQKNETEPARILQTIFKDKDNRYFELTVSTPTIEKADLREAILNWIITLYFALLFVVLAINIWVFHQSMKPLYVLLKWIDQYTIGKNQTPPTIKTKITEFRKLNEATRHTVKRNQDIFEQQKQFIGNASHELQTPLAACQNRLEMLVNGENLTEEQLVEIAKIQHTLTYIIRLNKSLLFLSKIENGQFSDNKQICFNTIIRTLLDDYTEIYAHKQLQVQLIEKDKLQVMMNETLATALASNLLKNAFVHGAKNGELTIRITQNSLEVSNTGIDHALDQARIFERFYHGTSSGEGSSGLGLSIASSICRLYKLQIGYSYSSGGIHSFAISFPFT